MKGMSWLRTVSVLALLSVVVLATSFCYAQTPVSPQKPEAATQQSTKKKGLAPAKRLELALAKDTEPDALTPIIMHTIERGLQGSRRQGTSPLDEVFDRVLQRHPEIDRALLQRLVTDYKAIPASIRTRRLPASLANLDPGRPLEVQTIRAAGDLVLAVGRSVSRPAPKLTPSTARLSELLKTSDLARPGLKPPDVYILRIVPAGSGGYEAGQKLTLIGWGFSANKSENTIRILKTMAGGSQGEFATLNPQVASTEAMEFRVPDRMDPGQYALELVVRTGGADKTSNRVAFAIKAPPPPAPVINSISPAQYPGKKVLLTGQHLLQGRSASDPKQVYSVYFKPMDDQPLVSYLVVEGEQLGCVLASPVNDTNMEVTIPSTLLPGNYQVFIGTGSSISNRVTYAVRAYRYQVNFVRLKCIDESNPEWAGSDEVVTTWVVGRDTEAWAKNTGEYTEFDDGEEQNYKVGDRTVYMPTGSPGEVKMLLTIATSLYEWDSGDVEAANKVIGFVGDLAAEILKYFEKPELAVLVKALVPLIQKLVAWLGGDPDNLGTRYLAWTALELQQMTDNPQKRFSGTLQFRNSGDTGSYDVTYKVLRVE